MHEQYWLAGTKMVTSLWVSGFIYYVQKWLKSWSVISEILLSTCYQASSVLYIKDKKPNKFVLCPCRTWQFRSIQNTVLGGKPVLAQCAVTAQRGYRRWRREEGFWCAVRKEWGREMASWGEVSSCRFSRTGTMKLISGDWGRDSQTAQTPSSYPSLFMYSCLFLAMPRSIWLS